MSATRTRARVLIVTGPGKGKTTSALGVVLRSLGHGKKVLLARFLKAGSSGELAALAGMPGLTVLTGGLGFVPPAASPAYDDHVAAARRLFAAVCETAPSYDVLALDEICGATSRGMVSEAEVAAFLGTLRPDQAVILTGRDAGVHLIAVADTVSEIGVVKHGYARGIGAEEGIEL